MFFSLFFTYTSAQTRICICDEEFSSFCLKNSSIVAPSFNFNHFFIDHTDIDDIFEFNFYLKQEDAEFDLDISFFEHKKIILTNLNELSTIRIKVKKANSIIKRYSIHSNQQIVIPQRNLQEIDNIFSTKVNGIKNTKEFKIIEALNMTRSSFGWTQSGNYLCSTLRGSTLAVEIPCNQFWITGAVDNNYGSISVFVDGIKEGNVSLFSEIQIKDFIIYKSPQYESNKLREIIIDNQENKPICISRIYYYLNNNEETKLHINTNSLSNEKESIIPNDSKFVNSEEMKKNCSGSWTINEGNIYSEEKGSTISINIICSQFWIEGTVDPSYGDIEIYVDGQFESNLSFFRENHEESITLYESSVYSTNKMRNIKIINQDAKAISISMIYFYHFSRFDEIQYNLDGLINVTCDQLEYDANGWNLCTDSSSDTWLGSFSDVNGATVKFKFNGTRVHVLSYVENDSASKAKYIIDDNYVVELDSHVESASHHQITFSSEYLPYGEHTIEVQHLTGLRTIVRSFIVDPLPRIGGFKLDYKDISEDDKNGNWEYNEENNRTSYFSTIDSGAYIVFRFHGTRFWLTGKRNSSAGKFEIKIDEEVNIEIDGSMEIDKFDEESKNRIDENEILFYESNVLLFKDHIVKITNKENKKLSLINLLFSTQPYNAIYIPSEEIKFDEWWNKEDEGYSTTKDGARLEITKYFDHFWVIGNKQQYQSNMNFYYNERAFYKIALPEQETTFTKNILLYGLENIVHNNYKVQIEKVSTISNPSNIESLQINYVYYLNDKKYKVDDDSQFSNFFELLSGSNGTWDMIDSYFVSSKKDSAISYYFSGNKFWISGLMGPNYGTLGIYLDSIKQTSVSLYNEKNGENLVYYESPDGISTQNHVLLIINEENKPVSVSQINFKTIIPTLVFTQSEIFTESVRFTYSNKFSKSNEFTETKLFSNSLIFTKTHLFSSSKYFTKTNAFSKSSEFSTTNHFTSSSKFSKSSQFSDSNDFTKTNAFSKSSEFSTTNHFTCSSKFSKSSQFSDSNDFTKVNIFSKPSDFLTSNHFTSSSDFTQSLSFSQSYAFNSQVISLNFETENDSFAKSNSVFETIILKKSDFFMESSHFNETQIFSLSKQFTSTNFFTTSESFTQSMLFSSSKTFNKPTAFIISTKTSIVKLSSSFSLTYVMKKSVSLSASLFLSNTISITYDSELDTYSVIFIETLQYSYLMYVIQYYSPSYASTYLEIPLITKKGITQEQLIGVTCGIASVVLFVLWIILIIYRRKNVELVNSDILFYSSDLEDEQVAVDVNKKDPEIKQNQEAYSDTDEILFWL